MGILNAGFGKHINTGAISGNTHNVNAFGKLLDFSWVCVDNHKVMLLVTELFS